MVDTKRHKYSSQTHMTQFHYRITDVTIVRPTQYNQLAECLLSIINKLFPLIDDGDEEDVGD